ncbi:YkvA family protein [Saccharopolyspora sp. NFXS83]|uniref:YkvA family protein n=1 Tax=Saccharopolyspora sp. NFXS83 TaxID=2993560 RepID=UPI00224A927F|nr:YkvA family protein [Saccharopolyspora sp. NFXS83]MCX2730230.1 YkvA family protein [Saccharopolyspora sp. NFXS83]
MIAVGGVLVLAGLIALGVGDWSGQWWLLPGGLIAAGIGVLVAGVVARVRRRLAPLRAARRVATSAPGTGGPVQRLRAIPSMIAAPWRGGEAAVPRYQTVLWLAGVLYLIWPIDVIPDLLPLVGITDDIGVGAWLVTSLYAEAGNQIARQRAVGGSEED